MYKTRSITVMTLTEQLSSKINNFLRENQDIIVINISCYSSQAALGTRHHAIITYKQTPVGKS